ncbi:MAG: ion transporter, partial [Proteobacteria bacterium]|nr:ion transporter [Pseudomonadota bacterium]
LHLMSMVDASPKMQHILNGFWKALPGIGHVLSILLLFFYIYCVMGVFLFRDIGIAEFQHIGIAMKTMFQVLTGDDWGNIMKVSEKLTQYAWIYFISFYIILVFIILNLFIGVVVGSLQAAEEEAFSADASNDQQNMLDDLKKQITRLEKKLDKLISS